MDVQKIIVEHLIHIHRNLNETYAAEFKEIGSASTKLYDIRKRLEHIEICLTKMAISDETFEIKV